MIDDEELDTGNRGLLEVAGKPHKLMNKIIALIAVTATVIVVLVVVNTLFSNNKASAPASVEKNNEALERNSSDDRTVAGKMNEISERILREKRETLEAQQNAAVQTQTEEHPPASDALNSIRSGYDNASDEREAGNTGEQGEQRPLLKKDRILAGETLIETGGHQDTAQNIKDDQDDLKGITRASGRAHRISNRHFLLPAGSVLSCVLKTRIVTSYPGVPLCQLSTDIYSADGKVLLVRKGAQLTGDQQRAIVQGATRVFVNWTTIIDGDITVRVDALGTDSLGASGVPGWTDNHFWKRFGGAIMLSFIDDAFATMKNLAGNNNGNIAYDSTADSAQEMAGIALQNSINIPDTGYVNQGTVLSVIVPRNVDFSGVYKLN